MTDTSANPLPPPLLPLPATATVLATGSANKREYYQTQIENELRKEKGERNNELLQFYLARELEYRYSNGRAGCAQILAKIEEEFRKPAEVRNESLLRFWTDQITASFAVDPDYIDQKITLKIRELHLVGSSVRRGPTSRSQWVQSLGSNRLRLNTHGFFTHFREPTPDESARMTSPTEDMLRLVRAKEEPRVGDGTRQQFAGYVASWSVDGISIDTDSRNCPPIGAHKPAVLDRKAGMSGAISVRGVAEVIGVRDSDELDGNFTNEEVGQELEFLQAVLLEVQPWRDFVYGYLTDCRRFEFYKAIRSAVGDTINFERSGVLMDTKGWPKLRQLHVQSDITVGYKDMSIDGWKLEGCLGKGNTAITFLASEVGGPQKAVCKVYRNASPRVGQQQRLRELTALGMLEHLDSIHLPKVVLGSPDRVACGLHILLKSPIGLDISGASCLPVSSFASLVDTLQRMHAINLFHNDISPSNLFAISAPNAPSKPSNSLNYAHSKVILLDDFGSACSRNELAAGCMVGSRVLYYGDPKPGVCKFGAIGDLCALVRSVFVLTQQTFDPLSVDNADQLDEIMRSQLGFWEVALEYAYASDYKGLSGLFRDGGCRRPGMH